MENSQPLATDSFSYSWLINNKPSFDGLLESLRSSLDVSSDSVPMVHHNLNKIQKDDHQDFDFNVHPGSRSSISLVHADEIFSDGCIKPVFGSRDRQKLQASTSVPATPTYSLSPRAAVSGGSGYRIQGHRDNHSLNKSKKSPNKILQRCYGLFRPIYRGLGCSRTRNRVDDLDRKVLEVRSRSNSVHGSPDRSKLDTMVKLTGSKVLEVFEIRSRSNSLQASPERSNWAALKKTRSTCERLISPPQPSPTRSPTHYSTDESSIHEAILHCKRSFAN